MKERRKDNAVSYFKSGEKDVMVATDVASKGLDFPDIQHMIIMIFQLRLKTMCTVFAEQRGCGKTGTATTFIKQEPERWTTLLDLKHLLQEAKQRIPPVSGSSTISNGGW